MRKWPLAVLLLLAPVPPTPATVPAPQAEVAQPAPRSGMPVTITVYWAVAGQTDDTPHIGACGPNLPAWKQFAVSRDLFYRPDGRRRCGEEIQVKLPDGQVLNGVINDTMAARWTKRVDILVETGYYGKWEGLLLDQAENFD